MCHHGNTTVCTCKFGGGCHTLNTPETMYTTDTEEEPSPGKCTSVDRDSQMRVALATHATTLGTGGLAPHRHLTAGHRHNAVAMTQVGEELVWSPHTTSSREAPKRQGVVRTLLTLALLLSSSMMPFAPFAPPEMAIADSHVAVHEAPAAQRGLPTTGSIAAAVEQQPSRQYLLFTGFPFPLGPFTERTTVQTELVSDRVYSFEQEIRLSGISANVRSTGACRGVPTHADRPARDGAHRPTLLTADDC